MLCCHGPQKPLINPPMPYILDVGPAAPEIWQYAIVWPIVTYTLLGREELRYKAQWCLPSQQLSQGQDESAQLVTLAYYLPMGCPQKLHYDLKFCRHKVQYSLVEYVGWLFHNADSHFCSTVVHSNCFGHSTALWRVLETLSQPRWQLQICLSTGYQRWSLRLCRTSHSWWWRKME